MFPERMLLLHLLLVLQEHTICSRHASLPWQGALLYPFCALCCRARTVREPLAAFMCEMLPEHMRKTSRMELMYEDFEDLPEFMLKHIAEWSGTLACSP